MENETPNPESAHELDIQGIMSILPHRYPFLLIDRVVEIVRLKRIVAIKSVTINEPFFQGHFPGFPIMPGALIVEAIAQAGGVLLLPEVPDRDKMLMVFTGIDRAKFRRPVVPGDQLRIEVDVLNWKPRATRLQGNAYVNGKLCCEAVVTCQLVPRQKRASSAAPAAPETVTSGVSIHPSAIVAATARIPQSSTVGPYCTIGPEVVLGEECELVSHVVLDGRTRLGARNRVYPFASLGVAPQDLKYKGEPTALEIGDGNTIRECVTISRGTKGGGGVTRVGHHCLIMAYTHIGHDSSIGSHCILANGATLAGHVTVEDYASVGALCPVHQFCRIGRYAYVGGGTTITQDVLPYSLTSAKRETHAYSLNKVGLERLGFTKEQMRALHHAFHLLLAGKLNTSQALEQLKSQGSPDANISYLIEFIESSERGVIK